MAIMILRLGSTSTFMSPFFGHYANVDGSYELTDTSMCGSDPGPGGI